MAHRKIIVSRLVHNLRNSRLHAGDYRPSTVSDGNSVLQRQSLNATTACVGVNQTPVEGLFSPPPSAFRLSAEDTRRMVRLSMVQQLMTKLREVKESSISYEAFARICMERSGGAVQGTEMAKALNESGHVIVVGNIVFLRPDQVTKSLHALITQTLPKPDDPRRRQLEEMDLQKAEIDGLARTQVRSELVFGLGLLLAQFLAAFRLTFWDLSWDVMEPVCFFGASMHFMAAYVFFLRTSTEPTFEGYFQRRFSARQRKLMVDRKFDLGKYEELNWAFNERSREMDLEAQLSHCRPN